MRPGLLLAPCLIALAACSAPPRKSACAGLTYTDAGLSREAYGPCARAMVAELDRMHEALMVLGDAARPKGERLKARQACFNANTTFTRLMAEAGGTEKLVHISWADSQLSRMNYDLVAARQAYLVYCYYGLTRPEVAAIDSGHAAARDVAASLP